MRFYWMPCLAILSACNLVGQDENDTPQKNHHPTPSSENSAVLTNLAESVPANITLPDFAPQYPRSTIESFKCLIRN